MTNAYRDENHVSTLLGVSSVDGVTPVTLWADPTTHRLLTDAPGAGTGTVTDVSVVTANGVSGSVATSTTTPAITLTLGAITPTTVRGLTITTTTGTFTLTNAKTFAVTNTLTLSGTDSTVMTFPTTSATIARTDAAQTFTGIQTFSTPIATGSVATMTATVGGGVPTPPNDAAQFLNGTGVFSIPGGGGDMVLASVQTVTGAKTFGTIGGAVGKLILAGSTSGSSILNAAAAAGATTITLPGSTTTLVGTDTTDTLTNKTLTSPKLNENVVVTTTATKLNYITSATGTTGTASTNIVFSTSPTLVTPVLGVATATSINGATITSGTLNGSVTGTNTGDQTSIVGISGTKAQFDTAVTDGNIMFDGDSITNATSTAHRVFYGDGSGVITELALGADGTFLKSNGAAVAPSFAVPAGSGDVSKVGTPVNNQVGVWTGDGTIEGDADLTFDTTTNTLSTGIVTASGAVTGSNLSGTNTGDQTVTNSSDATSHTVTLSASGGSVQLIEGSNITLTTGGTGSAGTVTIASSAGGGTVTATGGALTSNAVVLGAGGTDTKVVAGVTTDGTSQLNLGVNTTTLGKVKMFGNTSGDVTVQPAAVAGTATVQTLPATTGTLVNRVTTANGVSASNTDGALSVTLGDITPSKVTITTSTNTDALLATDTIRSFEIIPKSGGSNGIQIGTTTTHPLILSTDNVEQMVIAANGAVNIVNGLTTANLTVNGMLVNTGNGATDSTAVGSGALNASNSGVGRHTAIGKDALTANTSGYNCTAIGIRALSVQTTGYDNTAVGLQALQNGNAHENTAVGANALLNGSIGNSNTAIGMDAGQSVQGSNNVILGFSAGKYETGSNTFYVDSRDRTNTAGDTAGALLYGTFSATPSSQTLKTNSAFEATYGMNVPTGQTYKINGVAIGGGDVTKVGTPANNQVGVWTGDGTIEGDTALTFDTATDRLSVTTSGITETGTIELGHASDTTIARASAGVASIEGNNIVVNTSSPTLATITTTGNIELGNASDTTLSRSAAGVIAVEGVVIPSISSTNTLTNKRITPRTGTTTSSATPTINTDNVDFYSLTAQTADITSFTTNLSGTPTEGQKLWIAITGTAARAITWGATFEASTVALPTTTVTTNRLDVGFVWNTVTSKWRCIASA